jgi:transcriptional regulator with GAF, ATPase, and Fis domain
MTPVDRSVPQLVRLQSQLKAAQSVSQVFFQGKGISDLIEIALKVALEVSDAQAGSVVLASPPGQDQIFFEYTSGHKIDPGDRAAAWALFQSGKPILVQDLNSDPRHLTWLGDLNRFNTRDLIAVPLKRGDGQPFGILEIRNKRHGTLDEADLRILTVISAFVAMACEVDRFSKEEEAIAQRLGSVRMDLCTHLTPVIMGVEIIECDLNDLFNRLPEVDREEAEKIYDRSIDVLRMIRQASQGIQGLLADYRR